MKRLTISLFVALSITAFGAGVASAGTDPGMTHDSIDPGMTHNGADPGMTHDCIGALTTNSVCR